MQVDIKQERKEEKRKTDTLKNGMDIPDTSQIREVFPCWADDGAARREGKVESGAQDKAQTPPHA